MNYLDLGLGGEEEEEKFEDKPEEIEGKMVNGQWIAQSAPPAEVTIVKPAKAAKRSC